ncbi:His Kinase A (phospho-acceptor) domain-containing protein [Halopelagius inordinatus]|uniref:histidine kinase n=1 Tax=Halopelagius inordinatus TaxID=553467 RepID=A0A1I2SY13_9EURY|nr:MEDS domain-containing protein [Halopelagius inordinatus]SFG56809.1 His Kinase A (phospho-acceptor) domain-containing protein [Halopelagius inordinatus]
MSQTESSTHRDETAECALDTLRQSPEFRGPVRAPDHSHANDHFALVYENREEQFAAVVPFVRQGLERGERCLYIAYENSREDVLEAMREGGIDVDAALDSGALSVHTERETYLRNATFDADDTISFLDSAIEEASEQYEALRVTGEMSSVLQEDPEGAELVKCEAKANYLFDEADGVALCQYNRTRFPSDVIRDVISTHPLLVHDNRVSHNVYYTPPSEFFGPDKSEREVTRLLNTLVEQTDTKTELEERTAELEETVARLERSNAELKRFAHAASHDLQEPLRMISSYLQLLEHRYADALDSDAREYIDFAVDGADRMREMIDGLLAYSRLDRTPEKFEQVDCVAALDEAVANLEVAVEESGAVITSDELPAVRGDGTQLVQLFQNLLDNAITYAGDDPPRIHVGAKRGDGEWVFSVTDDGIGISPERTEEIFDVFTRLHTPDEYEGSGIGLAICHRIVTIHRGRIWAESEPDEGSTFSFTVPDEDATEVV